MKQNVFDNHDERIPYYELLPERELYQRPHYVFGERDPHTDYWDRSGAYLLALRDGKVAVVRTKRGYFLPGGGLENGESDADCIRREVLEETGCAAEVGAFLCSAEHYTVHDTKGPFHPIQSYYTGTVGEQLAPPQEPDIQFLWLPLEEVRGIFYSVMQNRALEALIEKQNGILFTKDRRARMLAIVPFSEADFPALSGTGYESMSVAARRKMLAASERKTHEDGCYFEMFTIKDGETAVGFASLYEKEKDVVSVGLDIREPFRRRGYATRAAEPLAALLTGKGFSAIRTHVRTDNEASIRLHEKLGFTRTGQEKTDRGTDVFVFEKQL